MTATLTLNEYNENHFLNKKLDELKAALEDEIAAVFPIGMPLLTLSSTLNDNEIWLEGSTVSRTTYADLFEIYGTTYGEGDGSTTFVLPDFRSRALWGYSSFGYISAGLPNATGSIPASVPGGVVIWGGTGSGALYNNYSATDYTTFAAGASTVSRSSDNYLRFSLTKSNSIYGNSSTVQPPAIKVRVKTRYK